MNNSLESRLKKAKAAIAEADYLLIGGGSGLSTAAGLEYSGKRFADNFSDYIVKYEMTDMYSAGFYPFPTQEEKWAYWSRHILLNRYLPEAGQIYKNLYQIVKDKEYFVLTTNVDGQFAKAGFAADRLFATQGDYGKNQCAAACHDKLYDNESLIKEMAANQRDCFIPAALVPKCPICAGNMDVNLRKDNYFVQDDYWYECNVQFKDFAKKISGHRIVLIEIGVGYNTPGIIRFPFEQIVYRESQSTLIRINKEYSEAIKENANKTISFDENANTTIEIMLQ